MEVMITKVKPLTMMSAKILATLLTGLIQIAVIILSYFLARAIGWTGSDELSIFGMPLDLSILNAKLFIFFVVYFVLGYALYAFLFAALGSLVSRIEDLGSVMAPVIMLLVGSFLVGFRTMVDPNSPLVMFGTYFPFFSPIVTFSRIVLEESSTLEVIISLLAITLTTFIIGAFSSRIYVKGVMNYNAKPKFSDIFKMAKK